MTTAVERAPELLLALMTEDEAREAVAGIKRSIGSLRAKLVELDEREGWWVLGYESIEACCAAEFGWKKSHLYRQLTAGAIERNLHSPIGEKRESHLRPLAGKPPEVQREAFAEASANGPVTAEKVRQAVERIEQPETFPLEPLPDDPAEVERLKAETRRVVEEAWDEYKPEPSNLTDEPGSLTIHAPSKVLGNLCERVSESSDLGEIEAAVLKRHKISIGQAAGYFSQIVAAAEQGGPSWEMRLRIAARPNPK